MITDGDFLPGHDEWKTRSPEMDSVQSQADEYFREQLWYEFECAVAEMAKAEGWPAVLRAVSRAMEDQKRLFGE